DFFVSYAGLSFLGEKTQRFRYRMVGLDERWTVTALREIRYSGLRAGEYRFEVAARDRGEWSPQPATFSFRVVPPWWQTWWFQLLVGSGVTGVVALVIRTRMCNTARQRRLLEDAVRQRTAELELQKELVETQKGDIVELLRQSQEASRLKSEFLANMS